MSQLWKILELNRTEEIVNFGVRDSKWRELGAAVWCFDLTYTPVENYGYRQGPENGSFGMRVSAMRDGQCFGATQARRYFKTAEARDAAKAKYLASARKRAEHIAKVDA